jgi:hypothetical protein
MNEIRISVTVTVDNGDKRGTYTKEAFTQKIRPKHINFVGVIAKLAADAAFDEFENKKPKTSLLTPEQSEAVAEMADE